MQRLLYPYVVGSDKPIPNLFEELSHRSEEYRVTIFSNSRDSLIDRPNVREVFIPPEEKVWSRRFRFGLASLIGHDLLHTGGRGRRHVRVSKIAHLRNCELRHVHTLRADVAPGSDIGPTGLKERLVDVADVVTAVSEHTAGTAEEHFGVSPTVVYNGVDPREFHPDWERPPLFDELGIDHPVALFVGAFQRRKNPADVVAAARQLPDVMFLLIGDGPRFDDVEEQAADLENVVLTGRLSKRLLPAIYANASAFVFPSVREGCPNVVLEAMASGLPVVGYRATSMPELVEQGTTGYLVDIGDTEGLTGALDDAVREMESMGAAAREYAVEHHSFDTIADQYHSIYRDLL